MKTCNMLLNHSTCIVLQTLQGQAQDKVKVMCTVLLCKFSSPLRCAINYACTGKSLNIKIGNLLSFIQQSSNNDVRQKKITSLSYKVALFSCYAQPRRRKPAFVTHDNEASLCVCGIVLGVGIHKQSKQKSIR